MSNKILIKIIATFLMCSLSISAVLAQQVKKAEAKKIAEYKSKVVEWGINKQVSVKLFSGEKIEGRLTEINDQKVTIQFAQNGQVKNQEIQYEEMKKISAKINGGKVAGYTALVVLAGVGAVFTILIAVVAANGWD